MGNATPPLTVKKISAAQADESVPKKREPPPKTAAGFLLMDSSLCHVLFNAEAIEILSYPDKLANLTHSDVLLAAKIRSSLVSRQVHGESPFVTELRSGRRRYSCRAFFVNSCAKQIGRASCRERVEKHVSVSAPQS